MNQKCIVNGCGNYSSEGSFIGDLCYPCYMALTTGEVGYTRSFLGEMKMKIEELEAKLTRTCNLGEIPGLKEFLGFDAERITVYVATYYHSASESVGTRLFSTRKKAERYKECIGRLPKQFNGAVKITERFIDETRQESEARYGRSFSRK